MTVKSTSLSYLDFQHEYGYSPANISFTELHLALEAATETTIVDDGDKIYFTGANCKYARKLFREVGVKWAAYNWDDADGLIPSGEILRTLENLISVGFKEDNFSGFRVANTDVVAKNPNQSAYIDSLGKEELPFVFGLGPAGTGKTWIAVAKAIQMYKLGLVNGIVIARPPVEAGKTIGFLPGDQSAKLGPYVRPMMDALEEILVHEEIEDMLIKGILEINHIGFFRGRTFKGKFVIIDEAQNATGEQGKMVLTRLGDASYMVVTGDPDQCDLPYNEVSALDFLTEVFEVNEGAPDCVAITNFEESDCVRHPAVEAILQQFAVHRAWKLEDDKRKAEERRKRREEGNQRPPSTDGESIDTVG